MIAVLVTSLLGACAPIDDRLPSLADGPLSVSFYDGRLGAPRAGCPRTEIAIGPAAYLVVDTPNFYGQVRGAGQVQASWAMTPRTELFVELEAVRYQTVISSVSADSLGLGHTSVGFSHLLIELQRTQDDIAQPRRLGTLSWQARAVLPTATGLYRHARPLGFDIGMGGEYAFEAGLSAHAYAGLLGSAALSEGPSDPRLGGTLLLGGAWAPVRFFELVGALSAGFGYNDVLDYLAPSLGVRGAVGQHFGISLEAAFPVLGRERALTTAELRAAWRL